MFDIDEPDGLHNAQLWFKGHVGTIKEGGVWVIPRAHSTYRIHHTAKVLQLTDGSGDMPTHRVAVSLGWSIISNQ